MNTKNITIREGLKTLKAESADNFELSVAKLFVYGLRFANSAFAIPALQELSYRDASDVIVKHLDALIGIGAIKSESVFATTLASALCELDRTADPFLCAYGKALRDEGIFMGPTAWIQANAKHYQRFHRSGMVQRVKPWARKWIEMSEPEKDEDIPNKPFGQDEALVIPEVVDDDG